jgi:2'-hydroxyisoflavone reductase
VSAPGAFTMGDLVTASVHASPKANTRVTWVPEDFLREHWKPDELDLPPWSPMKGDSAGASLTSVKESLQTGLRSRPIQQTVTDTLAWFQSLPPDRQANLKAGLPAPRESDTLRLWHQANG